MLKNLLNKNKLLTSVIEILKKVFEIVPSQSAYSFMHNYICYCISLVKHSVTKFSLRESIPILSVCLWKGYDLKIKILEVLGLGFKKITASIFFHRITESWNTRLEGTSRLLHSLLAKAQSRQEGPVSCPTKP